MTFDELHDEMQDRCELVVACEKPTGDNLRLGVLARNQEGGPTLAIEIGVGRDGHPFASMTVLDSSGERVEPAMILPGGDSILLSA